MNGIEFKELLHKYVNNNSISVREHDEIRLTLSNVAINAFKMMFDKYGFYMRDRLDCWSVKSSLVHEAKFLSDSVEFAYWDDTSMETSSYAVIAVDELCKWIDNDVNYITTHAIATIKKSVEAQLKSDIRQMKALSEAIDTQREFLSNVDSMDFDSIVKWYDNWIDDAI